MNGRNTPSVSIRRLLLGLVVLCSCIGCDQATKSIATQTLAGGPPQSFLGDTVRLEFALNAGGFLSLGSGLPDQIRQRTFITLNTCVMLGLVVFLVRMRRMSLTLFLPLVCMLAGGIGNLLDRIWNDGLVTDFIIVGVGPLRSGIFNVADVAIMFGAIAVFYASFRSETDEKATDENVQ